MAARHVAVSTLPSEAGLLRGRLPERDDVQLVVSAFLAGQSVPLEEEERNAAVRRALLVFAAGGGLEREPELDDPAVVELAADLDAPARRSALGSALEQLDPNPHVLRLRADPELAWRAFACSLLAEALGED
jgi:hypothetical protein